MLAQQRCPHPAVGGGSCARPRFVAPLPTRAAGVAAAGRRALWRRRCSLLPPLPALSSALPAGHRAPQGGRMVRSAAAGKGAAGKQAAGTAKEQQEAAAEGDGDKDDGEDDDEDEGGEWGDEDEGEDEDEDGEWVNDDEGAEEEEEEDEGDDNDDDDDLEIPAPIERWQEDEFVEVGRVTRPFGVSGEVRVTPLTDQPRRRLGRRGVQLWLLPPRPGAGAADGPAPAGGPRPALQPAVVRSGRQVRPERRGGRPGSAAWAVRLSCAPDREGAERLAGCTLLLRAADREALPGDDGEFYVQELVGMTVVLDDGGMEEEAQQGQKAGGPTAAATTGTATTSRRPFGRVVDVLSGTGAHDTLRVRLSPTPADVRRSRYRTVLVPFCEAIVPRVSRSKGEVHVSPPEGLLEATAACHRMRRAYTPQERDALLARLAAEGIPDDEEAERAKEGKGKHGGRRRRSAATTAGGGGGGAASKGGE